MKNVWWDVRSPQLTAGPPRLLTSRNSLIRGRRVGPRKWSAVTIISWTAPYSFFLKRRYSIIHYLYVPLIVAAVLISSALAVVRSLWLGDVVFWRRYSVCSFGNLHRFTVYGIGHSHRKVLLGYVGEYTEPERQKMSPYGSVYLMTLNKIKNKFKFNHWH